MSPIASPPAPLKVSVCQMVSTDDVPANINQVWSLLTNVSVGTDLILFPENSLFFRLNRKRDVSIFTLTESVFADLSRFCQEKNCEIMLGSLPLQEGREVSNATIHITATGSSAVYRKIHLFDVDVEGAPPVRESEVFRHGSEPRILEIKGWKFGLSICYDLRFPELYLRYAREGVHALFVPSAFLVPTGAAHWHVLLRARAIESQAYVIAPAQGGQHKGLTGETRQTYGHSLSVAPWGQIIAELDQGQGVLNLVLDPKPLVEFQSQIPMARHRRLR